MSTTREYKDGGQAAPQWKPAVVWGANHAHGPEVAYHKDDAEAYNLHGSPEKGKCMLLADQLGYLGRGRWSSGTFPVRWQCTQTCLWWHNAGICCAAEPRPTDDWVLQGADHTLTEPFLCRHHCWRAMKRKSVGKLSQFWLATWILRTVGNKPQLLESTLPVSTSCSWCRLHRAADGPCSSLHDRTAQHSVSRGHFLQPCCSKIHPQSLSLLSFEKCLVWYHPIFSLDKKFSEYLINQNKILLSILNMPLSANILSQWKAAAFSSSVLTN